MSKFSQFMKKIVKHLFSVDTYYKALPIVLPPMLFLETSHQLEAFPQIPGVLRVISLIIVIAIMLIHLIMLFLTKNVYQVLIKMYVENKPLVYVSILAVIVFGLSENTDLYEQQFFIALAYLLCVRLYLSLFLFSDDSVNLSMHIYRFLLIISSYLVDVLPDMGYVANNHVLTAVMASIVFDSILQGAKKVYGIRKDSKEAEPEDYEKYIEL